ncbi:MAG: heavy metal translocating P-type ATPase metal-binding domain-containing protein [Crocinitomicaceae bacterium]|jgi:Cu+-exporting ATPase|nr:heavy metal translocating P-type ATPase metal-binding domain-containing protein [Crocinitomicaceae bacterium]
MEEACYHCSEPLEGKIIESDGHSFCCKGCASVYTLLKDNDLSAFYDLEKEAGQRPKEAFKGKFDFLELAQFQEKIVQFREGDIVQVTISLPSIHCSSCVYLLENLNKINSAILSCQVHFLRKEATIRFNSNELCFSKLAELLQSIGYVPHFGSKKEQNKQEKKRFIYQIGIAGFAFGSIMLWSVPDYLGIESDNPEIRWFTTMLSLLVSLPVFFFSAQDYLKSGWKAVQHKSVNLDVPISIGILALYGKSLLSVIQGEGPGYLDSFAGFIFFLLIGKWFQNRSYASLNFERDYSNFFPVAVYKWEKGERILVTLEELNEGDTLVLRNEEILPCDAELLDEEAQFDYSFITGESEWTTKKRGDLLYAGGKLVGSEVKMKCLKRTERSQLVNLWKQTEKDGKPSDQLAIYFTLAVLVISLATGIAWTIMDISKALSTVVSVLIVACPCALALSRPFVLGNAMTRMGRKGLFLRNSLVVEELQDIQHIVFDKTGTLTQLDAQVDWVGESWSEKEEGILAYLLLNSSHPYAKIAWRQYFKNSDLDDSLADDFKEQSGQGVSCEADGKTWKLGSKSFVCGEKGESGLHFGVEGKSLGLFVFHSVFRSGLKDGLKKLKNYELHILSGDTNRDLEALQELVPIGTQIHFEKNTTDNKNYIDQLQAKDQKVLMIGDGLNDIGALNQANVGIAISEDEFRFTPSSKGILQADQLVHLNQFFGLSAYAKRMLYWCFGFSITYNTLGLIVAISGYLTPLFAAILMPLSSLTIVLISTLFFQLFLPKRLK